MYIIYDIGHFKSKSRTAEEFRELFRNSFVGQYNFQFPIWQKSELDKTIDKTYKFTPKVIFYLDNSFDEAERIKNLLKNDKVKKDLKNE